MASSSNVSPRNGQACTRTISSQWLIDYTLYIKVSVYKGNNGELETISEQKVESANGDVAKLPLEINALIPSNNTPFIVEITVVGKECSNCASHYGADISTAPCGSIDVIENGVLVGKKAAIPRWYRSAQYNTTTTEINNISVSRTSNLPNTCWSCIINF